MKKDCQEDCCRIPHNQLGALRCCERCGDLSDCDTMYFMENGEDRWLCHGCREAESVERRKIAAQRRVEDLIRLCVNRPDFEVIALGWR